MSNMIQCANRTVYSKKCLIFTGTTVAISALAIGVLAFSWHWIKRQRLDKKKSAVQLARLTVTDQKSYHSNLSKIEHKTPEQQQFIERHEWLETNKKRYKELDASYAELKHKKSIIKTYERSKTEYESQPTDELKQYLKDKEELYDKLKVDANQRESNIRFCDEYRDKSQQQKKHFRKMIETAVQKCIDADDDLIVLHNVNDGKIGIFPLRYARLADRNSETIVLLNTKRFEDITTVRTENEVSIAFKDTYSERAMRVITFLNQNSAETPEKQRDFVCMSGKDIVVKSNNENIELEDVALPDIDLITQIAIHQKFKFNSN